MSEAKRLYKVGDVADLLATSIRAIRYYEEQGLVAPLRSAGGTRLYSERQVSRLRAILTMTESGYSLGAIKALASARERHRTGGASQKAVTHRLTEILDGIALQIRQLQALAGEIRAARSTVGKCAGCRNKPTSKGCPACPVLGKLSEIELLNLVWDQDDFASGDAAA